MTYKKITKFYNNFKKLSPSLIEGLILTRYNATILSMLDAWMVHHLDVHDMRTVTN
jgi:hypothetical protein